MKRGFNSKYTIEYVREEFFKRGYLLLDDVYINCKTKLKYICTRHSDRERFITFDDFKSGTKCKECGIESLKEKQKHSFDIIEKAFEERGYLLLDTEYKNNATNLKYLCPFHENKGIQKIKYANLRNGQGCKYCGRGNQIAKRKLPFETVKVEFTKNNYTLLENEYINANTKMKYICNKHPEKVQAISYSTLKQGHGCRPCGNEKLSKAQRGENAPNWKGGVKNITEYLRQHLKDWKIKCLEVNDYKCFITGKGGKDLEIHHIVPYNKIRDEMFVDLNLPYYETIGDYTQEQINILVEEIRKRHENAVGIPVKKEIHKLFHSVYGYDDQVTLENLYEFKERFLNDEFEDKTKEMKIFNSK